MSDNILQEESLENEQECDKIVVENITKKKKNDKKEKKKPDNQDNNGDSNNKKEDITHQVIFDKDKIIELTDGVDFKEIFKSNSTCKNDDIATAFLIKNKKLDYKCYSKSCKIASLWKNQPLKLLLVHINGINSDFRISNLTLYCPNCYFQEFGSQLLKKIKTQILTCEHCGYNKMEKLRDFYKKKRICITCFNKQESAIDTTSLKATIHESVYRDNIDYHDPNHTTTVSQVVKEMKESDDSYYNIINEPTSYGSSRKSNRKKKNTNTSQTPIQIHTMTDIDLSKYADYI